MIDLREKTLPDFIEHGGERYYLHTDFRVWIQFDHNLQHNRIADSCIFVDRKPPADALGAVMEFYQSPNVTPRGGEAHEKAVDMVWDGDYIVASFIQAYGIDLTKIDYMHWHVFKALLYGLPDDTVMARIMAYRTYRKSNKKHDDMMQEQKRRYRLPTYEEVEEKRNLLEWAEQMGL